MAEEQAPQPHFSIQKLYIKDSSFESPDAPNAFGYSNWNPKIELNLNNAHSKIEENLFEVILTITATVNHNDKVAYLVEAQQAGLFGISGFSEADLKYLLGSQCMNILFPYAREVVSDLSNRGGFPPLVLSPVNFDALYQQHMKQDGGESVAQTDIQEQLSEASGTESTKH